MTLAEAARLADILAADPSSAIAAAMVGWDHPISREAAILADLFDLYARANFKNPKPHPMRPTTALAAVMQRLDPSTENPSGVAGRAAGRSRAEIVAILRDHGHDSPPV